MERVYEVSSSTRRLSGCPGGKGVSMTVRAGAIKHVAFVSRLHAAGEGDMRERVDA